MTLYTPPDLNEAIDAWGANCGPGSLAAALGRPLADVFEFVADPPPADTLAGVMLPTFRGYMGIGQMKAAIANAGASVDRVWRSPSIGDLQCYRDGADPLLACVQWGGPWSGTRGAAVHRHWVAMRTYKHPSGDPNTWVYDVNIDCVRTGGGWVPWPAWEHNVPPMLRPDRGDGTWS